MACVRCGSPGPMHPAGYNCKNCHNADQRAYYARSRDKIRPKANKQARLSYIDNKEKVLERTGLYYRETRRYTKHGLTKTTFEDLLKSQGGVCAICGVKSKRWYVDHDHTCCPGQNSCGKCVRGILCNRCNTHGVPVVEDPAWVQQLLAYIERNTK